MYSSVGKRKGLRCQICTGCGLCPGVASVGQAAEAVSGGSRGGGALPDLAVRECVPSGVLHVLAEDALWGEKRPLMGGGRRLVTADVGTTTIAMLLYDEDGGVADRYVSVNPQTAYGADVLSRIRAAEDMRCAAEMRRQAEGVLEQGIRRFKRRLGEGQGLELVLAANVTMTYLLMGWDTGELGHAPFAASRLSAVRTRIAGVPCLIFPGISAFVGGDIVSGIHACRMAERQEITLLIDLGTNGEMVLGNCHGRIACATAAGPAFEGGANRGVWGADMVSLLAALLRENIMDGRGLLVPEYFEKGIRIGNVHVTQEAVRSIQLAKAAIAAGIGILLDRYGMAAGEVDRVLLAGGFGYYLKPEDAVLIGLLPADLAGKCITGGNTALSGALLAGRELFASGGAERLAKKLEGIAAGTQVLNLAMEASFQDRYIQAMDFG